VGSKIGAPKLAAADAINWVSFRVAVPARDKRLANASVSRGIPELFA
jgi:hypothetical protein